MKFLLTLMMVLILVPAAALAGIGPCGYSTAEVAYIGPETAVVLVLPDGSGTPLTAARLPFGEIDATVTLRVLDCTGLPVPNYPAEDMWLESADGGLAMCAGGTTADANTDANGEAFWVQPLHAGGSSQALTVVMLNGAALTSSAGLALAFNSPDLNGDRMVNLSDVQIFASDFFGGVYMFRSDLYYDNMVNLSDIVQLSRGVGANCP